MTTSRTPIPAVLACVVLIVAACAYAGSASARQLKTIPVSTGDVIDITGTKIACTAVSTSKRGMICFEANSKGPIAGTYGAALAEDGEVIVNRINADGSVTRMFKRTAGVMHRASRYYKVTAGDVFGFTIKGGSLGCKVLDITSGAAIYRERKVACWRSTETDPFPNTYGIAVSDTFAGVFTFDAKGVAGPDTYMHVQPGHTA